MADDKKLCKTFLRAAAKKVRTAGLARGARMDAKGQVCMLGAMDYCGVTIDYNERMRIEKHVAKMLPLINGSYDTYNQTYMHEASSNKSIIAWWSNMKAVDAEEVAEKLELAAESC